LADEPQANTFGPDDYRLLIDTIPLNETHRLPSEATRALEVAPDVSNGAVSQMRVEVNVAWLFAIDRDWDSFVSLGATLFLPEHIPYLLERETYASRPFFKAAYSLAAWLAQRRRDYAVLAADALLTAVDEFLNVADNVERFTGLRRAVPLAYGIGAAAGRMDDVRSRAWSLVRDLRRPFDVLRAEIAGKLARDKNTSDEILDPLSDVIGELMQGRVTFDNDRLRELALLGKRVDARLKRPEDEKWDRRLGEALGVWIESHPEPMAKAIGAQEAAAPFARAGDETKVLDMRRIARTAIEEQETVTISVPFEEANDFHDHLRSVFRGIFNSEGADGVLRMLAAGPHIIPDVSEVRAHEAQMERDGIGTFVNAVVQSHEVSADSRIIDHAAQEKSKLSDLSPGATAFESTG
jgi:hypothetical protein